MMRDRGRSHLSSPERVVPARRKRSRRATPEQLRCPLPPILNQRLSRPMQGGPAHVKRAGATMATAGRHSCRIALHEVEGINRQTEQSGEHLREGGFVALAIRLGAHRHAHAAVRQERQPRILVRGTACGFEKAAYAEAAQLAAPARLGAAAPDARAVCRCEHVIQILRIVTAIEHCAEGLLIREAADEVAFAQHGRVDAQTIRRLIHERA